MILTDISLENIKFNNINTDHQICAPSQTKPSTDPRNHISEHLMRRLCAKMVQN
jgi:hypothetical protein